jgi:hypothetical protein
MNQSSKSQKDIQNQTFFEQQQHDQQIGDGQQITKHLECASNPKPDHASQKIELIFPNINQWLRHDAIDLTQQLRRQTS